MIHLVFLLLLANTANAGPAHIPGFKVPSRIGELRPMKPQCGSAPASGPFRVCTVNGFDYIEFYRGEKLFGQIKARLPRTGDSTAWVDEIQVDKFARGRGLSIRLLQKMIEVAGPQMAEIRAHLAALNYRVTLEEYFALTDPCSARLLPELTIEQANTLAVQASPFVRALSSLGFSEVVEANFFWIADKERPYPYRIDVTVRKKAAPPKSG